jgi:hypothetical protein
MTKRHTCSHTRLFGEALHDLDAVYAVVITRLADLGDLISVGGND